MYSWSPQNRALLRPNLDAFLDAASNLYGNDSQIRKNLKVCEAVEDFWDPHHHPCLGPAPSPGDEGSRASSFPGQSLPVCFGLFPQEFRPILPTPTTEVSCPKMPLQVLPSVMT